MVRGFIDSASLHSTMAALMVGNPKKWTAWDGLCALNTTYLLLHNNMRIVPDIGSYRGAHGPYRHIVAAFPHLESRDIISERALRKTKWWLSAHEDTLKKIWSRMKSNAQFLEWAFLIRRLFYVDHVRMYGALFNAELTPRISALLGCEESELARVHHMSQDDRLVASWARSDSLKEDGELAKDAWLLAGMIRGKFHWYLARQEGLQLFSHPFRYPVERHLTLRRLADIPNSEEYFVKTLIGTALRGGPPECRVKKWVDSVREAQVAIDSGKIALPRASSAEDAEQHATIAARAIGLAAEPAWVARILDWSIGVGAGIGASVWIAPWAAVSVPLLQQLYRHSSGESIGDDLASMAFRTKRRFRKLGRAVPGKIQVWTETSRES